MTGGGGIIKRTYDLVALFVLLNVIGVIALGTYLIGAGVIDRGALRTIGAVLRGEELVAAGSDKEEAQAQPDAPPPSKPTGTARLGNVNNADPHARMQIELFQREAERIEVELDQRLKLINSILLRVENERRAFEQDRQKAENQSQAEIASRRHEGFEKQVAIFRTLAPKVAVQHLLAMNDPSEAAKILIALDADKGRKIVEAARRGDDLAQMQVILREMRTMAPARSEKMEDAQP